MLTFLQPGNVVEFTAPSGGVTSGVPVLIGGLLVVPTVTAAVGARFNGMTDGVHQNMPKATGSAWTEGQILYWDSTAGNFATAQSATARRAGVATKAALSGDAVGTVRLNGVPSIVNVA